MGGRGKNIHSRKWIRRELPNMPTPFTSIDMADATNLTPKRVWQLLDMMDDVRKERVKDRRNLRCVWYYEPGCTP